MAVVQNKNMERSFVKEINHRVTRSACSEVHLDDHQSSTDMELELAEARADQFHQSATRPATQ